MEVINIFEIVEDSLYSVQYKDTYTNEFEKLFDCWSDQTYLREFFTSNIKDLSNTFYNGINIDRAIEITRREAKEMEKHILSIAKSGINSSINLSSYFEPISDNVVVLKYDKRKGKAINNKKSWLRVYAIKIDENTYVISGGAIKLTKKMHGTPHLEDELHKLELTKRFLKNT